MAYYTKEEMMAVLEKYPQYREKLYCRGFLLTNCYDISLVDYPFYGNWRKEKINDRFYIYVHKDTMVYTYSNHAHSLFLVGHAYDPFAMLTDENQILQGLSDALLQGEESFWKAESNLTGVFCLGYLCDEKCVYTTDCAGMQLVYHGVVKDNFVVTSHSKLVADIYNLKQDPYIEKLVNSKFYHYWGTWLPGDLSPYLEMKRMQPNCCGIYDIDKGSVNVNRYYPTSVVKESETEEEYVRTIEELGNIMSRTMKLIGEKWPDKRVAISVTGGRDSMTALACANGNYDKFKYFSYISNGPESVDAYAAKDICQHLGLEHSIYTISDDDEEYPGLDAFKMVMECNAGCIGQNNRNDVRKRMYFSGAPKFDIEVKSWVNEMGRGWYYNKYNKKSFPDRPNARYWRAMHKVYLSPDLIRHTDKVFQEYLDKYYTEDIFNKISWLELYFWEFAWSGGEGVFLTSEHRVSYEITIPFNNRRYIEKMLTVPLHKRIADNIPKDLITSQNAAIAECGIVIKDVQHTNLRALIVRVYLEIMSRIGF